MFSVHDFIMKTLRGMVGSYPDFQAREYALNWYGKGKLTEQDLETVEGWLAPAVPDPFQDPLTTPEEDPAEEPGEDPEEDPAEELEEEPEEEYDASGD